MTDDRWSSIDWRDVAFTAPVAILVIDPEFRVAAANSAAGALFGLHVDDLVQLPFADLVAFKAAEPALGPVDPTGRELLEDVLAGHANPVTTEVTGVRPSGAEWVGVLTASSLKNAGQGTKGLAVLIIDATPQRSAEVAFAESEDRFRWLFEKAPVAMALVDDQHTFLWVNPQLCELLDYSETEILGRTTDSLTHPDDLSASDIMNANVFGGVAGKYQLEKRYLRGDGTPIWIDLTTVAFDDTQTRGRVAFGMFIDITERKQAEEARSAAAVKLQHTLESAIFAVGSAVDVRDPYTSGHQRRVTDLAVSIATELGLAADQINGIRFAAMVHDVGKLGVPSEILATPRPLHPAEYELVKAHPDLGATILADVDFPWPIQEIIRQHHERLDGSGYPRQLVGDEILLEARIIAVADVVESMASHRPYRHALGIDAALNEVIEGAGRLYDETVVEACVRRFRIHGYQLLGAATSIDHPVVD